MYPCECCICKKVNLDVWTWTIIDILNSWKVPIIYDDSQSRRRWLGNGAWEEKIVHEKRGYSMISGGDGVWGYRRRDKMVTWQKRILHCRRRCYIGGGNKKRGWYKKGGNGTWKGGMVHERRRGSWEEGMIYERMDGTWKEGMVNEREWYMRKGDRSWEEGIVHGWRGWYMRGWIYTWEGEWLMRGGNSPWKEEMLHENRGWNMRGENSTREEGLVHKRWGW